MKKLSKSENLPCFIYDVKEIDKQLNKIESSFKKLNKNTRIFYSYKTNTSLAKYLNSKGLGFQVTSLGHLKEALKITQGKNIIFSSRELSKKIIKFLMERN